MLIIGQKRYVAASFDSEQEIESVVANYSDFFFGPASIYLPKTLIRTPDGYGTVPDAYVVDIALKRWFVVEVELASHSVWNHIAPQVARQIIAASQPLTGEILTKCVIDLWRHNETIRETFDEAGIAQVDIEGILRDTFARKPIIGLPIDSVTKDLKEWAQTINSEVRLWVVRKLVAFDEPTDVIYELPDDFTPTLDTVTVSPTTVRVGFSTSPSAATGGRTVYDVSIVDLINAKLLQVGEQLTMTYGPRGRQKQTFHSTVEPDGSMTVDGRKFSSPSDVTVFCMQKAGSNQRTANGWIFWKNARGECLSDLRAKLL